MKNKILYLFAAASMLVACNNDLEDYAFAVTDDLPAASWLKENGYSRWVDLLEYTGTFSTINLDRGNYTLFVPENGAVDQFLAAHNYASIRNIDADYAKLLVKYHTIAGKQYMQSDFSNDILPDTTATGDRLTVTFDATGEYYVNDTAKITHFEIEATNATLYVINSVLVPITEYLGDRVAATSEWSIFNTLIKSTLNPAVLNGRTAYTLFVVPDEVFRAKGINNIDDLADMLAGPDATADEKDEALTRYAGYHLIRNSYSTNDLSTTSARVIETFAGASYLEFQEIDAVAYINYNSESATGTQITEGNINCKNGMIHVVNTLLTEQMPTTIPTTTWDLCDYEILSIFLGADYRLSSSTQTVFYSLNTWYLENESHFCYTYNRDRSRVYYELAAATDTVKNKYRNHDALNLELGQYQSITMTTPTIMASEDTTTYSVNLVHYNGYASSQKNLITIYIDGERVGQTTTAGDDPDRSMIANHLVGTVKFVGTKTHEVRIEDNDGSDISLDYIIFTPRK